MNSSPPPPDYDVVVIGGALAGASTAFLLKQKVPDLRVLVLDRSQKFGRKVGEATVEVSAYFLCRVLGLTSHLNEYHIAKQGLRFWFTNDLCKSLEDCSEMGSKYLVRLPSYQVDRAVLDEEVLARAHRAGAAVLRGAVVHQIDLSPGGVQTVHYKHSDQQCLVRSRWVVDASGVAAILARQEGWLKPNREHPTTSVWSRWKLVQDWDGLDLAKKFPAWSRSCFGIRGTATNHFFGYGWWAWCIPLKGGDVSIGVVFDQRIVQWPEGGTLGQRLKEFLMQHPAAAEIMRNATWVEGDVHWRKNLPYSSNVQAGDGFALVGDAAGFIDPFYSPGMDWISYTVAATVELIEQSRMADSDPAMLAARHNDIFLKSYDRWFRGLYQDKYYYFGDFELLKIGFLLDLGLYYMGVARQPYLRGWKALLEPVFSTPPSRPFYCFMRFYNRRLSVIGKNRFERGEFGRMNYQNRFFFGGYIFSGWSVRHILKATLSWLCLELKEGWRTWGTKKAEGASSISPVQEPVS
ncbi:MAG: NAD(P)/FAD-dependent oxidoreductase [Verrucomicrobiota bacterium]|nr:NAD(P)/FAD-dependent oxidoreductase [Verrucomicrobiota bacterium]